MAFTYFYDDSRLGWLSQVDDRVSLFVSKIDIIIAGKIWALATCTVTLAAAIICRDILPEVQSETLDIFRL
jgi:hypothetical protein